MAQYHKTSWSILYLFILAVFPFSCQSLDVYVDISSNVDCSQTTKDNPCNNLTDSLVVVRNTNNSIVHIANGLYTLLSSRLTSFSGVSNITIIGAGDVMINCTGGNAGLSFVNVKDITIEGVSFIGCGAVRNSTTRNFSVHHASDSVSDLLLPMIASIYFDSCQNVRLRFVTVSKSMGVAVQFFSTSGTNEITGCTFSDNGIKETQLLDIYWGGGLYIEFPYCSPGNNSCYSNDEVSFVNKQFVSNSNYTIFNCSFTNNQAKDMQGKLILPFRSYHKAAGRGGGLSIYFKGDASSNKFSISDCDFVGNEAVYGGGLYLEMQDSTVDNTIKLSGLTFTNNQALIDGGGLLVSYLFVPRITGDQVLNGVVNLHKSNFTENTALSGKGGGVCFISTRQTEPNSDIDIKYTNEFTIDRTQFRSNKAFLGSAVLIRAYDTEPSGLLETVIIANIEVHSNQAGYSDPFHDDLNSPHINKIGSGALYIHEVPIKLEGIVSFENNSDTSALKAYGTTITISAATRVVFENNSGHKGGAIGLHASSVIVIGEGVIMDFTGNVAYVHGGAIYAELAAPDSYFASSQNCFIQYYNITKDPNDWNAVFNFENNTVYNGPKNAVFATSLQPCLWGQWFGYFPHKSSDLTIEMDRVFCWNDNKPIWNYNGSTTSCRDHINTAINHFDNEYSLTKSINVTPGNVTKINITGYDDQNETVSSLLILHVSSLNDDVKIEEDYKYTSTNNIMLRKLNAGVRNAELILETVNQGINIKTTVSINILDCPLGFHLSHDGKCVCLNSTFDGILKCDNSGFTSHLLSGYWIGTYQNITVVAHCIYCDNKDVQDGYYSLTETTTTNESGLCEEHREGILCSKCTEGYEPAINSDDYNCVKCDSTRAGLGILLFIVVNVAVPFVVLVFLYIFDVPLMNGLLHGPIFFAQMITSVVSLDAEGVILYNDVSRKFPKVFNQVYNIFYDIFNLEFFMGFQNMCIGVHRFAGIVALQYIPAFVPLVTVFLFGIIYFCFNSSQTNRARRVRNCVRSIHNVTNILATCILLSYNKVAVITCFLLTSTRLLLPKESPFSYKTKVLYIDGSIEYLSREHIPYFMVALIVSVLFLIPVPVLLFLCRANDPQRNSGLINSLLDQFQHEFRSPQSSTSAADSTAEHQQHIDINSCDTAISSRSSRQEYECPDINCFGRTAESGIRYEHACCTDGYLCMYKQKQGHWCCCVAILTSFRRDDYRWCSANFFILRIVLILPFVIAWTTVVQFVIQFCVCMVAGMLVIFLKPYSSHKSKPDTGIYAQIFNRFDPNKVEAWCLFNLAAILALNIYQYYCTTTSDTPHSKIVYALQVVCVIAPFVWIVFIYGSLLRLRFKNGSNPCRIFPCCQGCCQGEGYGDNRYQREHLLPASSSTDDLRQLSSPIVQQRPISYSSDDASSS